MAPSELSHWVAAVHEQRVLVLSDDGRGGIRLPHIDESPDAADLGLVAALGVERALPLGPALLLDEPPGAVNVVAPVGNTASGIDGAAWLPLRDLDAVLPAAIVAVIRATLAEYVGPAPRPRQRPVWFSPGWLTEADAWIDRALADAGRVRGGASVPQKVWSLSAVLRIPLGGDEVGADTWFKATCDWFHREPAITAAIAVAAGDDVAAVRATDHDRGWMLMDPLPGPDIWNRPEAAAPAAAAVARIHIAALGYLDPLRAAGCPDRRAAATTEAFAAVVSGSVELDLLTPEQRAAVTGLVAPLAAQLDELDALPIPSTIIHGDPHAGNIATDGDRVAVFDWSDAALAHPFLDAAHLARSWNGAQRDVVRDAYCAAWREGYDDAVVDRAWELALLGERAYQAITYELLCESLEPAAEWQLRGYVARSLRDMLDSIASSAAARE